MAISLSFPSSTITPRSPHPRIQSKKRSLVVAAENGTGVSDFKKMEASGMVVGGLPVLYDDGYGLESVKDYLDAAKEFGQAADGGPPRWFCPVECGRPLEGSPLLLFLPGIDGVGMGLILHHKSLGKVFEVRCLHIPIKDRTPFEGLVKCIEHFIHYEYGMYPKRPIYLIGDSLGGCLALAVAARNPTFDLVLVLANPATSFDKSQLRVFFPVLEALPRDLHVTVPYLLSFIMGDPVKMAMASVADGLPSHQAFVELSESLTSLLPRLSDLADIIPKETLLWKLNLLKSAASYTNSRLHSIEAEVLVLASGNDNLLPSGSEADRFRNSLKNCKVRYFKDSGHALLLEDGFNLLSIIKGTRMYRRSGKFDFLRDYLPPSITEFRKMVEKASWFDLAASPVIFSTMGDGRIVRGLAGVPNEGPVLLVGNHMLMGLELYPLVKFFLSERNIIIRAMAHSLFFSRKQERKEYHDFDIISFLGTVPVSAANIFKLLSSNSYVLLYPGGVREGLHRKGEEYKLFWPKKPEFVRMAACFEATIVPFSVVGEDDILELVLDYDDQMRIPFTKSFIEEVNEGAVRIRPKTDEVSNQDLYLPGVLPKLPGRLYCLLGKPIQTRGRKAALNNRETANELYLQIKSEVENSISYLKRKREEDPYRGIIQRTIYRASRGSSQHIPTFEP